MKEMQRRTILKFGAGAAAVAATSVGFNAVTKNGSTPKVEPFFGKHQAGIRTVAPTHANYVSFNLKPEADRAALGRLMRVWTKDASLLTAGKPALVDNEATLAVGEANLTITFGIGPKVLKDLGHNLIEPLPNFSIDKLDSRWTGGDLVIQICANDPLKIHHAVRELVNDAKPFAEVHWKQNGFLPATDLVAGKTPRNLLGQKDGTANFDFDSADFEKTVWINSGPAKGGTTMVIRRIQMDLDNWEKLSPDSKSKVIGRDIDSGAPLSGGSEFSPANFVKTDHHGLVIPADSHMRRARLDFAKIHRRSFNYQTEFSMDNKIDQGLIFVSYQADLNQFISIQRRLESMDSLNTWTTPIGSAVFLIPPGIQSGQWIGHTLI